MTKLVKITAAILIVLIPLNMASEAQAGLWTDIKAGFKKFYYKFKKAAGNSTETVKKESAKTGRNIAEDAKKAGGQIKDSSREMGRSIREGANTARKEIKSFFKSAKEKLE